MRVYITTIAVAGGTAFGVLIYLVSGGTGEANLRAFDKDVAKVQRFCGASAARAFRATHDKDNDNSGPVAEWVKRCTIGDGPRSREEEF